ncbi:MAG: tetratricopeptide repeat protein, partial [Pseudomonadota bacterium]|nr:tetratricopeptide repeat protein [Pseudomonadota bacterium]
LGYLLEAEIHLANRSMAPAIEAMKASLARSKSTAQAIRLEAMLTSAKRQPEAAQFAASWLKEHPRDLAFLAHLGATSLAARDYPTAEVRYRAALAVAPNDATILNNVAWLMIEQGKRGALALATAANEQAPGRPAIMQTLAAALKAEGRLPDALQWQRRAVANSDNAPAQRLSLAKLLLESGDRTAAKQELQALAQLGSAFKDQAEVATLLRDLS